MELKVGMYVRYTRGAINGYVPPRIAKIINKNNDLLKLDNNNEILESDIIGKPSFDLIDLIEVGDYVNSNKVTKLSFDKLLLHCKTIECHQEDLSRGYEGVTFMYTNNDIKDVITKEQFNACKYVVERDK